MFAEIRSCIDVNSCLIEPTPFGIAGHRAHSFDDFTLRGQLVDMKERLGMDIKRGYFRHPQKAVDLIWEKAKKF